MSHLQARDRLVHISLPALLQRALPPHRSGGVAFRKARDSRRWPLRNRSGIDRNRSVAMIGPAVSQPAGSTLSAMSEDQRPLAPAGSFPSAAAYSTDRLAGLAEP